MEQKLKEIFQHSFDMMKLSETKNAGLIAFNGVIIVAMIKLYSDLGNDCLLAYYFLFVVSVCSISVIISLSSMVAQLRHKERELQLHKSDNLLFFGTVAYLTPDELINSIKSKYNVNSLNAAYELDLARQAIIMSQIAIRKYKLFNLAILWTLAGIGTPCSILIYLLFYNPNKF